jgi:hypothetical protein
MSASYHPAFTAPFHFSGIDILSRVPYRRSRTRHETGGAVSGTLRDIGGPRTPEELETLLEDALVMRDRDALAALFAAGATLVTPNAPPARGTTAIARLALATWGGAHPFVADPRRVVVAREVALVVGEHGLTVARRGGDGAWRYAIVLQTVEDSNEREREEQKWFSR